MQWHADKTSAACRKELAESIAHQIRRTKLCTAGSTWHRRALGPVLLQAPCASRCPLPWTTH